MLSLLCGHFLWLTVYHHILYSEWPHPHGPRWSHWVIKQHAKPNHSEIIQKIVPLKMYVCQTSSLIEMADGSLSACKTLYIIEDPRGRPGLMCHLILQLFLSMQV